MKTLENIKQHSNKLQKLVEYSLNYKNNDLNLFKNSYTTYQLNGTDKDLYLNFDKDIKHTANTIFSVLPLLKTAKNGVIEEFNGNDNTLEEIFGNLYNKETNVVNINGLEIELDYINDITKKDILESLVEETFQIPFKEYKEVLEVLESYDTAEGIEKLSLTTLLNTKDNVIDTIKDKLEQHELFFKKLTKEERILIDEEITFNRTMIDGIIKDSSFVSNKNGVEQINPKHKGYIHMVEDFLEDSKYFESIEIEKNADIYKTIKTLERIENLNLNITTKINFKVRLLGNYNANGLYMDNLKLVAVDTRAPSALIHELTHMIDFNSENSINREYLVEKYTKMIDKKLLPEDKQDYYLDDREVIARLGEIAFLLQAEEDNDFIINNEEDGIPIIKTRTMYERNENIYFNMKSFTNEDKLELKEYFNTLFTLNKNTELSKPTEIKRKPEMEDMTEREKKVKEESDMDLFLAKIRYENKELKKIYSRINHNNIEELIETNKKMNIMPMEELLTELYSNMKIMTGSLSKTNSTAIITKDYISAMVLIRKIFLEEAKLENYSPEFFKFIMGSKEFGKIRKFKEPNQSYYTSDSIQTILRSSYSTFVLSHTHSNKDQIQEMANNEPIMEILFEEEDLFLEFLETPNLDNAMKSLNSFRRSEKDFEYMIKIIIEELKGNYNDELLDFVREEVKNKEKNILLKYGKILESEFILKEEEFEIMFYYKHEYGRKELLTECKNKDIFDVYAIMLLKIMNTIDVPSSQMTIDTMEAVMNSKYMNNDLLDTFKSMDIQDEKLNTMINAGNINTTPTK